MSTPAPLLHSAGQGGPNPGEDALFWKAELNARLRQHRERRGDRTLVPEAAVTPAGRGTPASRVAARVAERYSQAPSYRELLAASAAAAVAAAKSAAEAALEAQAAAEAVLAGWAAGQADTNWEQARTATTAVCDGSRQDAVARAGRGEGQAVVDVFADPFFTDTRFREPCVNNAHGHALGAGETLHYEFGRGTQAVGQECSQECLQECSQESFQESSQQSPSGVPSGRGDSRAASPIATVEYPAPLPVRTGPPERLPLAERTRALVARSSLGSFVDAFAEAVVPAAQSLPAKLIEFPRELIAPRKQRPRLAEGPLLEPASVGVPLRIFEVDGHAAELVSRQAAEQITPQAVPLAAPAAASAAESWLFGTCQVTDVGIDASEHHTGGVYSGMVKEYEDELPRRRAGFSLAEDAATPAPGRRAPRAEASGWGSIRLGEHPQAEGENPAPALPAARRAEHGYRVESEPALHDLAPIGDRLMSALVDGGIVLSCFLISLLVFATCTVHPPTGKASVAIGLIVFGVLACFYGWLFMSFGGGSTPGMRYAHIALCTFGDENPTRKDLQNRVPATALALLPLGLGVFWALLDEDKLGWHDRMTRTYQRSYR